jgi:hypothetical protein
MRANRLFAVSALLLPSALGSLLSIPPAYNNGTVTVEELSVAGNLDGPKLETAANRSSFDFWYFGAMSSTNKASVIVTFFNSAELGNKIPLSVQVSGSFPNGSLFTGEALATADAVLSDCSGAIAGSWGGTGASFTGTALDKPNVEYHIRLDMIDIGVKGTVTLKSVSVLHRRSSLRCNCSSNSQQRTPARYPCDFNVAGVDQSILPSLFWSNAVPDAEATVQLDINGTSLSFIDGVGYHDKNWGNAPVYTSAKSWDWGHARFGPYSVVWFDILDRRQTEHTYAFVAKDGEPIHLDCADASVRVRQWGGDATYPPAAGLGDVKGVDVRFNLGNGQFLAAKVTTELLIENLGGGVFTRAIGSVEGGIEGLETFEGRAMYDENIFP